MQWKLRGWEWMLIKWFSNVHPYNDNTDDMLPLLTLLASLWTVNWQVHVSGITMKCRRRNDWIGTEMGDPAVHQTEVGAAETEPDGV